MLRKTLLGLLVALVVVVALLASLKVYYVRTQAWGWLFWDNDKAYIFIGMEDRGYRLTYLGLAWETVREIFPFGASAPTDRHSSVLVLGVTPDSVQHYPIDNFWLTSPEPFSGVLYAYNMLDQGEAFKWVGDHFEPESKDEQTRVHDVAKAKGISIPPGPSYDNVEGWSKRTVSGDVITESATNTVEKDSKVTIELDGKPLTFVMNSGFISHEAYVDLERSGQASQRIWSLDERAHRISQSKYEQIFASK